MDLLSGAYLWRVATNRSNLRDPVGAARLRVLEALGRGHRTVVALAGHLGVTDNAVRGHLAALERDAFVRAVGVVRSGAPGQPAAEYEMTTEAQVALSRAYAPALTALVEALSHKLDVRAMRTVLRNAGRRLAPPPARPMPLGSGAEAARELLTRLGGSVRLETGDDMVELHGDGCPLAAAVAMVPATCTMVEAMLESCTGRKVEQRCAHGPQPKCAFRMR